MFGKSKIFVTLAFIFTLIFTTTTAFADYAATAARTVPAYHDEKFIVKQTERIWLHIPHLAVIKLAGFPKMS